ncbi:subunit P of phosphatidylinositol n-acetylglucosaminyltransferase [Fusarium pseudoanthophilum]|uniref:Subunit P of phosphatidylinositol n-acetylglucosaminyltransferase n=1 Tax=Fusarium pseudoanthophilum TaxID=48495 RepID=A0A8H5Q3N2_9HYPO|nr:subunit P of phosphatidylinositol n-acetylglucosaminyltransferase [Fusarium pseudoanthophilum]
MDPTSATALIENRESKQTTQGPSSEEWEEKRDDIYKIYITQGQPLKALICEMKNRFGFDATQKMYTNHFKKWGSSFNKNRRENDSQMAISTVNAPRTRPRRLVDDIPSRSGLRLLQPHPSADAHLSDGVTKQRSIMSFSEVFVYGLFDTFNFSSNLFDIIVPLGVPDHSPVWQQISDECFGVTTFLEDGQYEESRQTFNILCERLKGVFGSNDCGMIIVLWPICIRLHQTGQLHNNFALLEYFLDLLRFLAQRRYPSGHPIPNLLKVLRQTPAEERLEILRVGYLGTIRSLERRVEFGNAVVLSMWSKYLKRFDGQELHASALTSRYENVLQEAENSFTRTGTRAIEILHGSIYAAYYNAKNQMLTWDLASEMVERAELVGLDQPQWCLATQGYAMAAKLLYTVSEQTGHGNEGQIILWDAITRLASGDRECQTRALMLAKM